MDILKLLQEAIVEDQPVALCTIVDTKGSVPRHAGAKMIVYGTGRTIGTVGGGEVESLVAEEALKAIKDGKTRFLSYDLIDVEKGDPGLCGGSVSIFVEPHHHPATVVVVGAGHVGKAVVHLASWLGFHVVVSDDRSELCTPDQTPGGDVYLPIPISKLPDEIAIDSQTYFVLVTRGVDVDVEGLPAILKTESAYIGLIGSKRRWTHAMEKLSEIGVSDEDIKRIKSPIGLDINAETPEEIAISIMGEIINQRNTNRRHLRK
jgi:xanthine dehydrogenase accessory factor